jgi:hypothetical protein
LLVLSLLSSCGKSDNKDNDNNNNSLTEITDSSDDSVSSKPQDEVDFSATDTDQFTDRDSKTDYDESKAVKIELSGSSAVASDNSVKISGSTVTITKDATHIISGSLSDGMIIVDAPDTAKLQLVFKSVRILSKTSAALYIKEADKVFVTLLGENILENGGEFKAIDDSNIDAAIFSKQDVTFNGSGSLDVNSSAGHGIVGKDDIKFTSGSYNIASSEHAIEANDSVRVKNATITADAGKDGIHSENNDDNTKGYVYIESGTLKLESEGDGISAGNYLQVKSGTIDILAGGGWENGTKESSGDWGGFGGGFGGGGRPGGYGGGMRQQSKNSGGLSVTPTATSTSDDSSSSMKGLKAENSLLIEGGNITVDSADDAIHSNISVSIKGGTFNIASGDDAIHAEESLTVSDGKITITESYEGLEALNVEVSGGNIKLKATDDGINAAGGTDNSGSGGRDNLFGGGGFGGHGGGNSNGSIVISGGTLYIRSSGDAMDANGTLEITGGHTTTTGPTSGDTTVLDYDKTGTISGGTFIGTGSSMMAQSIDGNGQGVIAFSSSQSAGTKIVVKDKKGNTIISHEPELEYAIVIISSPDIKSGETYTITVGTKSGEFEAS